MSSSSNPLKPLPESWTREVGAVWRKEWQAEVRSRAGLLTVGLFGVSTVFAVAFSTFTHRLSGTIAAGLLWVALLFAAIVGLPRTFVLEEEQGTGDLLRLMARPHAVFWGKALFNVTLLLVSGSLLAGLYALLARVTVHDPALLAISMVGSALSLAGGVTLTGALVAQAANRTTLAAAVSLPLLLPLVALGVAAFRVAFGDGLPGGGVSAAIGLLAYGIASLAIGPHLFAAVWKQ